jgi:D-amino-acid dehydrogenase
VREVVTSKGAFTADAYVLALGSYAPGLARSLGIRLPVYPVKGYSLTIPVGETNRAPQVMGVDEKYLIAWSRLGDRLRVTAKADFAGFDRSHTPADFEHMLATIRKLFPEGAAYDKAEHWAGLRPMTPRGTPILGASPLRNLFLNTGHGHMGWTMSLGSARIVSDLVAGRSPAITLAGLTPADAM